MPFLLLRLRKRRAMPALKGKREKKGKAQDIFCSLFPCYFSPHLSAQYLELGTRNLELLP
jgi:hypothetical protein